MCTSQFYSVQINSQSCRIIELNGPQKCHLNDRMFRICFKLFLKNEYKMKQY